MQSVLSRIWTRVAVFISYDDNHYTTGTSKIIDYKYFKIGSYFLITQCPFLKTWTAVCDSSGIPTVI